MPSTDRTQIPLSRAARGTLASLLFLGASLAAPPAAADPGIGCEGRVLPYPRVIHLSFPNPAEVVGSVRVRPGEAVEAGSLLATARGSEAAEAAFTRAHALLQAERATSQELLLAATLTREESRLALSQARQVVHDRERDSAPSALDHTRLQAAEAAASRARHARDRMVGLEPFFLAAEEAERASFRERLRQTRRPAEQEVLASELAHLEAAHLLARETRAHQRADLDQALEIATEALQGLQAEIDHRLSRQPPPDLALDALALAQTTLEAQEERLRSLRDLTQGREAAASAALDEARSFLAGTRIEAPFAGTVLAIHSEAGERAGPGGVVSLARTSRMGIEALVYITDLPKLRLGAAAMVEGDGWAGTWAGTVSEIAHEVEPSLLYAPEATAFQDRRVVRAWIDLDPIHHPEAARLIGNPVRVRIRP